MSHGGCRDTLGLVKEGVPRWLRGASMIGNLAIVGVAIHSTSCFSTMDVLIGEELQR